MNRLERYITEHQKCKRSDIINWHIKEYKLTDYLEIGVNTGQNFHNIRALRKTAVDPVAKIPGVLTMTSDNFFLRNNQKFDCIFIDGYHEKNQVYRDVENAMQVIKSGGFVFVHDCFPPTKEIACYPRKELTEKFGGKIWCGNGWEGFVEWCYQNGREPTVFDHDFGVGVIQDGEETTANRMEINYDNIGKIIKLEEWKFTQPM